MEKSTKNFLKDILLFFSFVIFVILVMILLKHLDKTDEETKEVMVCNNLEKIDNNTLSVYPEVVKERVYLEQTYLFKIANIDGKNITPSTWDYNGVMCSFNIEMCSDFCFDARMIVSVNYKEWEEWFYGTGNSTNN